MFSPSTVQALSFPTKVEKKKNIFWEYELRDGKILFFWDLRGFKVRDSTETGVTTVLNTGDEAEKHCGQSELHNIIIVLYILSGDEPTDLQLLL